MSKNGYKIDFATRTLIMNYKFAKAAGAADSTEYAIMQGVLQNIPGMKVKVVSGRQSKTAHHAKRMTYANMERYIKMQNNAEELMAAFAIAKEESQKEKSPYAYVRRWFLRQFPDCHEVKVFFANDAAEMSAIQKVV